jgi:hypothetical protein
MHIPVPPKRIISLTRNRLQARIYPRAMARKNREVNYDKLA